MSAVTDIYDFLTPVEDAIAAVFTAAGIVCYTPLGKQLDAPDDNPTGEQELQRERPRVEIILHPGSGRGFLLPKSARRITSGHLREKCHDAELHLNLITEADVIKHRAFLAQVLHLSDTLAFRVNDTRLLRHHNVQSVRRTGGNVNYNTEDDTFETNLIFDCPVSVQDNAWSDLSQP